jgi:putative ABC transport system substrate-binding protein
MQRRDFINGLVGWSFYGPVAVRAQEAINSQEKRIYRVGLLFPGTLSLRPQAQEFWRTLAELGFVDGKNLAIEIHEARGELNRLPALAAELVAIVTADNIIE